MKLALFSVSYAGFWGQDKLSLDEFIIKAHELGYHGIEIMGKRPHLWPSETDMMRIREIKNLLDKTGLKLACMAAYTNFTAGHESKEVPLVDMQVMYVEELAKITAELGGNLVRVFTGYEVSGIPFNQQWEQCVRAIQDCCDRAAKYGVTIGIQNHHDIGVHTDSLCELIRDINRPNVKVIFDAWTLALRGENIREAIKKIVDRMVYTTVADYIRLPRYHYQPELVNYKLAEPDMVKAVPIGEGIIDYDSFFRILREYGYDGWVAYEMCSPLRGGGSIKNLDYCAKKFVDYMSRWL